MYLRGGDVVSMWSAGAVELGGAARRLGHWAPQVLVAVIAAQTVLVLRPPAYDAAAAVAVPVILVALVLLSWAGLRQHDRGLCEDCMASMPLNPARAAQQYQARLAVAHLATNLRLVVGYLLVLLAGNVVLHLSLVPEHLGRALWAGLQLTLIYLVLSYSTHRRLQPWCPLCRGGGDEHVETPDRSPTGSRLH